MDPAFRFGVPPLQAVLFELVEELVIEGATAAEEAKGNPRSREFLETPSLT